MSGNKLVIIGDSAFAEIAYEYFTHDSDYDVVGFAVEAEYHKKETLLGLPVVQLEKIEEDFPADEHWVHVAVVYTQLNRLRARLASNLKGRGYKLASYISSRAFVWSNVKLGEHCFIFEDNTVQPFVEIGNNAILWSGNHIGHHSKIGNNVFVSSHVVISGFVNVGDNCFLGVNSTISNNVNIADDCWLGPGVIIARDTDKGQFFRPQIGGPAKISTYKFFKLGQ